MASNQRPTLTRFLRRIALAGTAALVLAGPFGSGVPAHAASPAPSPRPAPSPSAGASSKPAPPKGVKAPPTPLPPTAPKAGARPKAAAKSRLAQVAGAPATAASASLPATTCSPGCDLWAFAGTIPVAGGPPVGLPVWGFSTDGASGQPQIPGPTLIATETDSLSITLHNQVPGQGGGVENMSLEVPAAQVFPDRTGVGTGGVKTYGFGKLPPGTYVYEAGQTADAPRQVRMGLSGILIIRPANFATTNSAYGNAASDGFTAESTLALDEFDPDFNADPFGADPIDYHATLFLVNGRTFDKANPTFGKIDVGPGDMLLLRYANLGPHDRGVTIENERQRVLADDSHVLRNPADVATKWLNPGQVADSFVTVDPQAALGTQIPLFESGFHFNNGGSLGLGGAFTYLDVVKGLAGAPGGPVTHLAVTPVTNSGEQASPPETFAGTIAATSGSLTDAEWFLDSVGAPGSGHHFGDGSAGCNPAAASGTTLAFSCTIPQATLNALLLNDVNRDGDHVVWVHGQDAGGWGVVSGDVFAYDAHGPDTGALSVHLSPTNGGRFNDVANGAGPSGAHKPTTDVVVLGTAAAALSDRVITGAEYCLDGAACPNGSGIPVYVTPQPTPLPASYSPLPDACVPVPPPAGVPPPAPGPAPGGGSPVSLCTIVPTSVVNGLSEGTHTLRIHACEVPNDPASTFPASCRWGDYGLAGASISFVVDRSGPAAGAITIDPNPNNGKVNAAGNLNFLDSLQVAGTLDDSASGGSTIAYGEVFVTRPSVTGSPVGPADYGTGAEMIPANARWDSPTKVAYAYVPLAELTSYPEGLVRFWVHGRDVAGNWGSWAFADLTLDRTAPAFDRPPTPANGVTVAAGQVSFRATDPVSGGVHSRIVQAEWFVDQGAHLTCDPPPTPGCTPEVVTPGDPGKGAGTPIPIAAPDFTVAASFNTGPQPAGTKIVFRVKDAAGNWSQDAMVVTS